MPLFKSTAATAVNPAPTNPEDATKQALLAVVQVWLDSLQAMAVVTTFFVSIDSMLYSFPSRKPDWSDWSATDTLTVASLGGAIILHVCASILAYCGSFVLIRYRLTDAMQQEQAVEHPAPASSNGGVDPKQARRSTQIFTRPPILSDGESPDADFAMCDIPWDAYNEIRSLISVHQIHPFAWLCSGRRSKAAFKRDPEASMKENAVAELHSMVRMLTRCHTVTAAMTVLGFILALLGTIVYFWTGLPNALGIFASACLGGCLLAGAIAVM